MTMSNLLKSMDESRKEARDRVKEAEKALGVDDPTVESLRWVSGQLERFRQRVFDLQERQ